MAERLVAQQDSMTEKKTVPASAVDKQLDDSRPCFFTSPKMPRNISFPAFDGDESASGSSGSG